MEDTDPEYTFERETTAPTDTLMLSGVAAPGKRFVFTYFIQC